MTGATATLEFSLASLNDAAARAFSEREASSDGYSNDDLDAKTIDRDKIAALAALSEIEYERQRETAAKDLGVRITALDAAVKRVRPTTVKNDDADGLPEPQPWPDPVDGPELLNTLADAIRSHVVMAKEAADAAALWVLHTYLVNSFSCSPRLAINSPEKECGKSTLIDVLEKLTWRPLATDSIQAAGVFRAMEKWQPTLLMDEAENFLKDNDTLRGILNSGHRRGKYAIRIEGEDRNVEKFHTFGAVAIALIGRLPDTLESRSIAIPLRRARPNEIKQRIRFDRTPHLDMLACMARRWADDNRKAVQGCDPDTGQLYNRTADNWRTLFAIAGVAGGEWPGRARAASAARLVGDQDSIRAKLLTDIREILARRTRIASAELALTLSNMEGRPWAEWGRLGKPLTATALARLLAPFGIAPGTKRDGGETFKGYLTADFADAFERYLPPQTVTPSQSQENQDCLNALKPSHENGCDGSESVTDLKKISTCDGVTDAPAEIDPDGYTFNQEPADDLEIPACLRRDRQ